MGRNAAEYVKATVVFETGSPFKPTFAMTLMLDGLPEWQSLMKAWKGGRKTRWVGKLGGISNLKKAMSIVREKPASSRGS